MKPFRSFKTLKPFKTLSGPAFGFNDLNERQRLNGAQRLNALNILAK